MSYEKNVFSMFQQSRLNMIKSQLEARGISDPLVLHAFMKVDRRRFVLPVYENRAYEDSPLPIEEGQTISQPYIVAFMTKVLHLDGTSRVLEIGTGSGYQTAILAEICKEVYSIEIHEKLSVKAQRRFEYLNYRNIFCRISDGYVGWEESSPYDGIIVTCSPSKISETLLNQLGEGGRLVVPLGGYHLQKLLLYEKINGKIEQDELLSVQFVPMINREGRGY